MYKPTAPAEAADGKAAEPSAGEKLLAALAKAEDKFVFWATDGF